MAAVVTPTPSTQTEGGYIDVAGTGGADDKNRFLINSVVLWTGCHDMAPEASITVPDTAGSYTLDWQQYIAGTWTSVDTASVTVTASGSGSTVQVSSIAAMKSAMMNDAIGTIIVTNGTYSFTPGSNGSSPTSLWFAGPLSGGSYRTDVRANPVTIKAETTGSVIFDGGGGSGPGLTFLEGVHHQTWQGFKFANFVPASNGAVTFGGFDPTGRAAPHHLTLTDFTIMASVHRSSSGSTQDHAFYFAHSAGSGPNNITLTNPTIIGTDSLHVWGGIHAFHGDATYRPSNTVTITNLTVTGTTYPIILWCDTAGSHPHNWTITGASIANATANAMRYENVDATTMQFTSIVSTGSPAGVGFDSSLCSPRTDYTDLSAQATFTTCTFG